MYFLIGIMVAIISLVFLYINKEIFGDENPFYGYDDNLQLQTLAITLIIFICFSFWPLVILYSCIYLLLNKLRKKKRL